MRRADMHAVRLLGLEQLGERRIGFCAVFLGGRARTLGLDIRNADYFDIGDAAEHPQVNS